MSSGAQSATSHLETELVGHVLVVTMNRPEAKNALSPEMLVGMADAWDRIDSDPEIRCAILTGAGGVFCAGADLKAMNNAQGESDASRRFREDAGLAWKALLRQHRLTTPLPRRRRPGLEAAAAPPPAHQAADRGGGGLCRRGWHRDPAGDRHPGR